MNINAYHTSTTTMMIAMPSTNNIKNTEKSRLSRRSTRSQRQRQHQFHHNTNTTTTPFRLALCLLLLSSQINTHTTCSAFSPLFTTSSGSSSHPSIRKIVARVAGSTDGISRSAPSMPSSKSASKSASKSNSSSSKSSSSNNKRKSKTEQIQDKEEEDRSKWMSWMSRGSLSRHADEVRMREAEELGGVARSDRYSSR